MGIALVCATPFCGVALAQSGADEAIARGVDLQRRGDIQGALGAFRKAVELAPERVDAISNLAVAYLQAGRPADALPGLRKARAAAPEHTGVAYFLGLAYFQAGRAAEAERELAWVLESQPDNHQASHLHALALLKLDRLDEGIRALDDVVARDPANMRAVYTLGSAFIRAGLVDRAKTLVRERLGGDESPEAHLIRGSVHLANRDYRRALADFDRARSGSAALEMLHSQTGVALLYEGRAERAAEEFLAELSINPTDFNANAYLGWLLQQNGDSERALERLGVAFDQNGNDTGVRYLLAQVHASLGGWDKVEDLLLAVVEAQPDFVPAHVMLARAYAKLRRTDRFRAQRAIIDRLNERQQERDLEGVDQLYDGPVLSMPRR